jgi:hypothetical protein
MRSAGRVCRSRSARLSGIVLTVALLAAALIGAPAANALSQRGHTFETSFGVTEGAGLSGPQAVAVNESTGDAYVLDTANNRVVRFGPAPQHAFIEAWGYGVLNGAAEFQKCTANCRPGLAGFAKEQFDSPVAIAIDNAPGSPSHGDVYVVANRTAKKKAVIDKFGPNGEPGDVLLSKAKERAEAEGLIVGVAVDQTGTVWVDREEEGEEFMLERFSNEPVNRVLGEPQTLEIPNLEGTFPVRPGLAVDTQGNLYVTYEPGGEDLEEIEEEEEAIKAREKARKRKHEPQLGEHAEQPCERNPCFVAKLALEGKEVVPLSFEVGGENSTGVAVDLSSGAQNSGDVYLDNGKSVAALTSGLALVQRFGEAQLQNGGGAGLAIDAASGEVLVADAATGLIDAYELSPPGPPVVKAHSVLAGQVLSGSAELHATIDPMGASTHYRFQYGTSSCATSTCAEVPPAPGGEIAAGFGDKRVSVPISGLSQSTTYHFRVIAENSHAEGAEAVISEEAKFTTTSASSSAVLPDGRAWELVSPASKHGASVEPIFREGALIQSAANGKSVTYVTSAHVGENEPEGYRGPERSQILSQRTSTGWSSLDITTPNDIARGIRNGLSREYEIFSSELGEALVNPAAEIPLSPPVTENEKKLAEEGKPYLEKTLYLRHNGLCPSSPASCYEPLVTEANDTAKSAFAFALTIKGATPDLHHVVLSSDKPLTSGAPNTGLYEWSAGQPTLQLISVLPGGTATKEEAFLGGGSGFEMASTAVSQDGSRVVWRANATSAGHLYDREIDFATGEGHTTQIDEPNLGVAQPKVAPLPDFKTASADGSKVFFSDPQRLTADSTAPQGAALNQPEDLYVYEPEKPEHERLTDLTKPLNSGEPAAVLGEALASSDGSYVYLVANGVLAANAGANGEKAQPGKCRPEAPGACNLYVVHYDGTSWETPRFIARLSAEDSPDWGRPALGINYELKTMTSRVSPNGEHFAFMSDQSLTGYNNTDENSGVADEEVFLYNYAEGPTGHVVCASCNPSGAQPVGVFDTLEAGEGLDLVVDRNETWASIETGVDHWLAGSIPGFTNIALFESFYQSRYLLNDGRLFFNSSDVLVPRAQHNHGKMNVYEYEPKGLGSCQQENTEGGCVALISSGESEHESAFMDASESGNDVFFLTAAQLSPRDSDTTFDIYDARVCQGAGVEPCVNEGSAPPPPCSSEACRGPAPGAPGYGAPASTKLSSTGNIGVLSERVEKKPTGKKPLTTAQKLAAALKSCRRKFKGKKHSKKRALCEKQAHKKYPLKSAKKAKR